MSTVTVPAAAPTLVVRTVTVDTDEPLLHLLPQGPVEQCASWVRQGEGLVGWGSAVSCETRGPSRFEDAQEWWSAVTAGAVVRDEVGTSGSGLICFGSFPFADDSTEPARLVVQRSSWGAATAGPSSRPSPLGRS